MAKIYFVGPRDGSYFPGLGANEDYESGDLSEIEKRLETGYWSETAPEGHPEYIEPKKVDQGAQEKAPVADVTPDPVDKAIRASKKTPATGPAGD